MSQHSKPNRLAQIIIFGLCIWLYLQNQPLMAGENIRWFPAVLLFIAGILGIDLFTSFLTQLATFFEWLASHQATGSEGTARWGDYKDIKGELTGKHSGPFWGMSVGNRRKPIFSDFASNAMVVAPSGSGKGIYSVIPMGFAILFAKVFTDFKGELICILIKMLVARGEIVRKLNPSGLWENTIGKTDCLNPLDIIANDLNVNGGLRDAPDDLRELSALLLPEPEESNGDIYWREGSRRIIADVILIEVMIDGFDAILSSVALLIEDRTALEHNLRWIVGIDLEDNALENGAMPIENAPWAKNHSSQDVSDFAALVRARATNLLALMTNPDSKTFDSFISGAQQALAVYAFGRLAPAMKRSTFSVDELKNPDIITNLFIVADSSRMESYKNYIAIIQWFVLTAMKRHPNKDQPVYFILDEATNYKIYNLEALMTWGRSYGIRLLIIFQALSAFEKTYGKTALDTLLSETEIKLFLSGQRSPKTLELISKELLGNQSIMNASVSLADDGSTNEQMGEKAKLLRTPDQIRRMKNAILIIRQCLPQQSEQVSYAQIHPYRDQAGINPFYGKPFKKKIKVKLKIKK